MTDPIRMPSRSEREHSLTRRRWREISIVLWTLYLSFLVAFVAFVAGRVT